MAKMTKKEVTVSLFDEVKRLKALLKAVNEWRNTPEVQGCFDFYSSRFGSVGAEYAKKWYPILKQLDKEFPVIKR